MTIDLFEQLERHAATRPDEVALQTVSGAAATAITFRELIDRSRALSKIIREAGVDSGARVALLLPNDHGFGIAFLGAASAGAVIVPLDPSQDLARLCSTIAHADCRLLIASTDASFSDQVRGIRMELPELAILEVSEIPKGPVGEPWPLVQRDPDADFLLMYTGGTTGAPKGVRLTLRGVLVTIRDTVAVFPLSASDHILSILPLFHIMAIQANLLGPLYAGARVSYLQTRDPQQIVDAFREHRITAFLCVPLFYYQLHRRVFGEIQRQRLMKRIAFQSLLKLSGTLRRWFGWNAGRLLFRPAHQRFGLQLRGFGVGAARFSPEIARDLHDLGFAFFQGYGMTETSGLAAISPMSLEGGLSSGAPLKNIELRIDAPDAQGRGEILLRGENIMKGYWKDPEATEAALAGGWLRTGDIGDLSAGRLHVIGRKKEVIVLSSGKNIFPEPLEIWFQTNCRLIQEICIFGLCSDQAAAERLHAVIVPDKPAIRELAIANIGEALRYRIETLNRSLPPHERLSGFDVRFEPLPRTSSRKLQRFRIEEEFARAGTSRVVEDPGPSEAEETGGAAIVRQMIAHIKPGRPVRSEMNLELDLSFDSLERIELLSNIQEAFGLRIEAEQAAAILTVGDAMALARDRTSAQTNWAEWSDILREPLSKSEAAMADSYLGARPLATPLFFAATKLFCWAAKLLLRHRVHGPHKWASGRPLIISANHQSYLDFPLIAGSLPYAVFRRLFTVSTSRLARNPLQSWFGRTVRAIPIDPERNARTALRLAVEGLRRGMVMCVFPEGHRSVDAGLQPFRMGAAMVAVESAAETIPARIAGTGEVWGRGSKRLKLARVHLQFGAGIVASSGEDYHSFNQRLLGAVEGLGRDA